MDAKHTPGPWAVGDLDRAGQRIVRGEHIEICTCWHHSVGSIEMEMEANARLISAAPDMLAVLKDALPTIEELARTRGLSFSEAGGIAEQIRAIISKAEVE